MLGKKPATDLLNELPAVGIDDVAVRRLRQRILEDVAAAETSTARRPFRVWPLALPTLVLIVIGTAIAFWPSGLRDDKAPDTVASVFTNDGPAARWSRRLDGGTEWVELSEGHFRIEIREHSPDRRVIVTVPDGRIDDLGTVFDVVISDGATTQVRVTEGRVAIHLWGRPDVILAAGEHWDRPLEGGQGGAPSPLAAPAARAAPAVGVNASSAKATGHTSGKQARVPDSSITDQEAEDGAYLNVIRLLRSSRKAEAKAAARDYLRRFPDGFRRDEMGAVRQ